MPDPRFIPVDSLADPRLDPYRNVKDRDLERLRAAHTQSTGLFLVEGELVVRELARSRFAIDSVLLSHARAEAMRDWLESLPPEVPIYLASQDLMNQIVGFDIHRGVLAAARRGEPLDARDLIASASTLVILEDLTNHDNVGGIFRTAAGLAGIDHAAVLFTPRTCDPLYRKSVRVSIGQAMRLPFACLADWPAALDQIRAAGFTLIATTPDPDAVALDQCPRPGKLALLVGSEGPGLSQQALAKADRKVRIPMHAGVDSLNVVVATAIALHALKPLP